ncbi:MAG: DUF1501 domain-containing protein [Ferruginibacter sp.]|nr:DUF1501 domain-containing protein [Cytophagales bacterium]
MKRRHFLQRAIPASVLPLFINNISVRAYARSPMLEMLTRAYVETDRVVVLIQMNGGNDGLNTVVPLDQYDNLANARGNILLPENRILKLADNDTVGLHPSMTGIRSLYDQGQVAIVQSVGYPDPSFSHFRATDIWLTAADSNQPLTTGWAGRYLKAEFPDFPSGYPNEGMPDPLALQIGSVLSTALQGPSSPMGMAISNPTDFYQLVSNTQGPTPDTPAGRALSFVREVAQQTQQYAGSIKQAAGRATNLSSQYPAAGQNPLADQLKIVAQLIAGGLKTRLYVVDIGGFDTHANQISTGGTYTGTHATLLGRLSGAIAAFQDDLTQLGVAERVVGMTFSEFGRRIRSNSSFGTDHGAAAPLFVFGASVNGGVLGTNPIISSQVSTGANVPMQIDFRSVYATLLQDWWGVSPDQQTAVLARQFPILPLFGSVVENPAPTPVQAALYQSYPNPFVGRTTVPFQATGDPVRIRVYDHTGREISTLVEGTFEPGKHEVPFETNEPGTYYCLMESGRYNQTTTMICAR